MSSAPEEPDLALVVLRRPSEEEPLQISGKNHLEEADGLERESRLAWWLFWGALLAGLGCTAGALFLALA